MKEKKENLIYLKDIFYSFYQDRWLGFGIVLFFVFIAILNLTLRKPLYETTMLVSPVETRTRQEDSAQSGLVALLGLLRDDEQYPRIYAKYLALVSSPELAKRLCDLYEIQKIIFSGQWNSEIDEWNRPVGKIHLLKSTIKGLLGQPGWSPPGAVEVQIFLADTLKVEPLKLSKIVRISMKSTQPERDKKILFLLHQEIERLLRETEKLRFEKEVVFIENRLETEQSVELRSYLISMLQHQVQTLTSINAGSPFAAELIQMPEASDKANPLPFARVLLFHLVFGVWLSLMLSLFRAAYTKRFLKSSILE